jgi:hypothetical protein
MSGISNASDMFVEFGARNYGLAVVRSAQASTNRKSRLEDDATQAVING